VKKKKRPEQKTASECCRRRLLARGDGRLASVCRPARTREHQQSKCIRRVLLISIDGMHALDFVNCAKAGTCPNLAALAQTAVNYVDTSTSKPSDSFPGLMAIVGGGSPRTIGAFYDVGL